MRYEHTTLVNKDFKLIHTYKKDDKIISKQQFYYDITNTIHKIDVMEYTKNILIA